MFGDHVGQNICTKLQKISSRGNRENIRILNNMRRQMVMENINPLSCTQLQKISLARGGY